MIRLYLIRHGRQESALCNVNVPLVKEGREQAELCGKRLKKYHIQRLYSSNLIRAVETAQIINEQLKVPYETYENLAEMDFGELTGLTDTEICERFSDFVKERNSVTNDVPFPGGESGRDVFDRAYPIIMDIVGKAEKENTENIAIVTHGGLIRSVLAGFLGCGFENKLLFARDLENCSITQVDYNSANGKFYVERINDYAHIEEDEKLLRKYFKRSL